MTPPLQKQIVIVSVKALLTVNPIVAREPFYAYTLGGVNCFKQLKNTMT